MKIKKFLNTGIWSYIFQRMIIWYPARRIISGFISKIKPVNEKLLENSVDIQDLDNQGIFFLKSFVENNTIDQIKKHLTGASLKERFSPYRSDFTIDDVPPNVHVAVYSTEHILKCPEVLRIANHPLLLSIAAKYLGCKPTISNISIWWSFPADGSAQEAENFHRDVDDWKFVKFFLYLSDVDIESGPHFFVKSSHKSTKFLKIRRISDEEVAEAFSKDQVLCMEGKTGDAFMEDTFGLHKGLPPTKNRRLLLQVEYSLNPIAVYHYQKVLNNDSTHSFDKYINRLYLA